jgi:hypothetical protein
MAVASLANFTVPLANNQSASSQGLLMPKLKYRFRATFINFGAGVGPSTNELTKQIVDIKRPSVTFGDLVLDVYNSKVKLLGKPEWQDTTINLRDDSSGLVSQLVGQQLQKQYDFMEQASSASGIDYKFQIQYDMLDGGNGTTAPTILEQWEIDGCFISQADYGDMAYNSNDAVQIALTIKFDNAVQTIGTNGGAVGVGQGGMVSPTSGSTVNG